MSELIPKMKIFTSKALAKNVPSFYLKAELRYASRECTYVRLQKVEF